MSTSTATQRRQGATAALAALRQLEQAAQHMEDAPAAFYGKMLADSEAFALAIGPLTPAQAGAVTVIAEYIHHWHTTGGPNLEPGGWAPMSPMTATERRSVTDTMTAENAYESSEVAA